MKVMYFTNSDLGKHGNIGFRTFHVAKEAYKRGYLDSIVVRGNKQNVIPKKFIKKLFPGYRIINLAMVAITQYAFSWFPSSAIRIWIFDNICRWKIKKCDVVHIYEDAKRTIKQSHNLGNITIYDTQMAHYASAYSIFNPNGNIKEKEKIAKEVDEIVKYADYIICSSDFVIKTYIENGIPREKLIKLPHGVDLKKFKVKKYNKEDEKFTCLYVGILTKRKGIKYLLDAWEKLNLQNAELILCGRQDIKLQNFLKKYKNNKTIKFKGFIDPTLEYQKADIFIFPSLWESSAKVLYEAMACELPIITTPNAGPPFKDKTAGFIVPIKNSNAIAEMVKKLYNDKKIRIKMGEQGRKIVEKLSWDNYGKRMNDIYEKLVKSKKPHEL